VVKNYQSYLKHQSNYVVEISLIMDIDQIYLKIFTIEFKDEGKQMLNHFLGAKVLFYFKWKKST
jgi:hypothetical protein